MKTKAYFLITAIIFLVIAISHLIRIIYNPLIRIGLFTFPAWFSWVAVIVAGFLSYFGFKFYNKR